MAGGGDMKDIDDIYDMENYDSDDSPGEQIIVASTVHYTAGICISGYTYLF